MNYTTHKSHYIKVVQKNGRTLTHLGPYGNKGIATMGLTSAKTLSKISTLTAQPLSTLCFEIIERLVLVPQEDQVTSEDIETDNSQEIDPS